VGKRNKGKRNWDDRQKKLTPTRSGKGGPQRPDSYTLMNPLPPRTNRKSPSTAAGNKSPKPEKNPTKREKIKISPLREKIGAIYGGGIDLLVLLENGEKGSISRHRSKRGSEEGRKR